jgi:hypothetical protein
MEDEDNGFDEDNEIDNDSMANNEYEHDRSDEAYDEMRDQEGESFYAALRSMVEWSRNDNDVRVSLQGCEDMFVTAPRNKSPYYHGNPERFWEHVYSQAFYELVDFKSNNRCVWFSILEEATKRQERLKRNEE